MFETATISAAEVLTTAKNKTTSINVAPVLPSSADAAAGAGRPAVTSVGERGVGKPGKSGWSVNATAVRPIVVAIAKGTANQLTPPRVKALTAVEGLLATALCQYLQDTIL